MDKVRIINQHHPRMIIGCSLSLLLIIALGLLCPLVPETSFAESSTDAVITETGVNVGSMIAVALDPSIDIDVMPSNSTVYDKKAARLTVTTNNSSGYSLYMQTLDGTADLRSTDLSNTSTIAPLEKASTLEQFTANTWGYNLGRAGSIDKNRIYYPVPTTNTTIMETGGTSYNDEYDLTFGVAVSNSLPVGRYSNSVIISAIANPTVITSLNQAEYMQSMNLELCQNTDYGVTKRLTDLRDGKKYWVARLLDGNCWMTQNLALTLKDFGDGEGIKAVTENGDMGSKLTSSNTDFTGVWDENSAYPPIATRNTPGGSTAATSMESWDFGQYVLATPTATKACANQTVSDPLAQCSEVGFINVSDITKWHAEDSIVAWEGDWGGTIQPLGANLNDSNNIEAGGTYDAHYLVGNYYSWGAATAGQISSSASTPVDSSICPKNWQLPTTSTGSATTANDWELSGSVAYLLRQYGFITTVAEGKTTGSMNGVDYNVATTPIYLVRGGKLAPANLTVAGNSGFYVTGGKSGPNGNDAPNWGLATTQVYPSAIANINLNYKYIGRQIRCVIY